MDDLISLSSRASSSDSCDGNFLAGYALAPGTLPRPLHRGVRYTPPPMGGEGSKRDFPTPTSSFPRALWGSGVGGGGGSGPAELSNQGNGDEGCNRDSDDEALDDLFGQRGSDHELERLEEESAAAVVVALETDVVDLEADADVVDAEAPLALPADVVDAEAQLAQPVDVEDAEAQLALPVDPPAKPRPTFGKPSEGSEVQNHWLASRMREVKANNLKRKERAKFVCAAQRLLGKQPTAKWRSVNRQVVDETLVALEKWQPRRLNQEKAIDRDISIASDAHFVKGSNLAHAHGTDVRSVRRSKECTSFSGYLKICEELDRYSSIAAQSGLLSAHAFVAFDHSKTRVTMPLNVEGIEVAELGDGSTGWQTMVHKRGVLMMFRGRGQSIFLPIPGKPVACESTNCNCSREALFELEGEKSLEDRVCKLVQQAAVGTYSFGMDGAYSNEKLFAHEDKVHRPELAMGPQWGHKILFQTIFQ